MEWVVLRIYTDAAIGSIIMLTAYGYELKTNDEYVNAITVFESAIIQIFEKGFLVDFFPISEYLFLITLVL